MGEKKSKSINRLIATKTLKFRQILTKDFYCFNPNSLRKRNHANAWLSAWLSMTENGHSVTHNAL